MAVLHEIVAVRKGTKSRAYALGTALYKKLQKASLFNGMVRRFEAVADDGPSFPDESSPVVEAASKLISDFAQARIEFLDVEASQEGGNQIASAHIVLADGTVVAEYVPVTLLMALEKELTDVRAFVGALPVLDPSREWHWDSDSGHYRSETVKTHKTQKQQRPIVLYHATPEHPAQTQLVSEDVLIGHWSVTYLSTAVPATDKQAMLARVDLMADAIKQARMRANQIEVERRQIGRAIFDHIFTTP